MKGALLYYSFIYVNLRSQMHCLYIIYSNALLVMLELKKVNQKNPKYLTPYSQLQFILIDLLKDHLYDFYVSGNFAQKNDYSYIIIIIINIFMSILHLHPHTPLYSSVILKNLIY